MVALLLMLPFTLEKEHLEMTMYGSPRYRRVRLGVVVGTLLTLALTLLAVPTHATTTAVLAASQTQSTTVESPLDDGTLTMNNSDDPTVYEMVIDKPSTATYQAVDGTPDGQPIYSAVQVMRSGFLQFTIDEAFALGADGSPVGAHFVVSNGKLYQHLLVDTATVYPVTFDTIDDREVITGVEIIPPQPSPNKTSEQTTASKYISIPSTYRYRPSWGSHHDYCTAAPDEFPAPFAANASFRGPCARHDQCYAGTTSSRVRRPASLEHAQQLCVLVLVVQPP